MGIHVEWAGSSARVTDTHWSWGGVRSRAWRAAPLDDLSAQVSRWRLQSPWLRSCLVSKIPPTAAFSSVVVWCGCPVKPASLPGSTLSAPCCPNLSCMPVLFFFSDSSGVSLANSFPMALCTCGMGPWPGPVCSGPQFQLLRLFTTKDPFLVLSASRSMYSSLETCSSLVVSSRMTFSFLP